FGAFPRRGLSAGVGFGGAGFGLRASGFGLRASGFAGRIKIRIKKKKKIKEMGRRLGWREAYDGR
ncbi:hypothetical protein VSU19_11650, partial [Verrucomicrobiales bacterium BCK34]|nr:hypothetical protein [Verrucomicrobiales bacterium BCK34]